MTPPTTPAADAAERQPEIRKPEARKAGIREHSKRERRDRIMLAARELFSEQGYDVTTLRQIAAKAGLGLATLFNYVRDKRDLIYLIFNEEMDTMVSKALAAPRPWQPFTGKLLSITELHFRLFAQDPMLARILMSEVLLESPGLHLERYRGVRQRLLHGIEAIVAEAQDAGELSTEESPDFLARQIYFSFNSAVLWWLATPEPVWRTGQRDFERLLRSQMHGLTPAPVDRKPAAAHPDPSRAQTKH